jgi:hypothetical protein
MCQPRHWSPDEKRASRRGALRRKGKASSAQRRMSTWKTRASASTACVAVLEVVVGVVAAVVARAKRGMKGMGVVRECVVEGLEGIAEPALSVRAPGTRKLQATMRQTASQRSNGPTPRGDQHLCFIATATMHPRPEAGGPPLPRHPATASDTAALNHSLLLLDG